MNLFIASAGIMIHEVNGADGAKSSSPAEVMPSLLWMMENGMSNSYSPDAHPLVRLRRGGNYQICGDSLVETLSLICGGKYYRPAKRTTSSAAGFLFGKRPPLGSQRSFGSSDGQEGNSNSRSLFMRNVRGIADECCVNSCSWDQIKAYCGD